ncbi:hypothetical protein ZHAS_00007598 [Anopheles sinensis]|uniref:Uncharacterized protein n=1 Tax=Anopheles sinensis TaxID=74873 RepID=A0A084VQH8_ANOSI|nr:hypothetical protein ZHAS_00007598 [Anopheles sinensis]
MAPAKRRTGNGDGVGHAVQARTRFSGPVRESVCEDTPRWTHAISRRPSDEEPGRKGD